ncbi:MAG: glyoxalase [Chloroflexi bacterium GWC2_73_18]|nr:MAG: glyoxalase [Chloroflexi bacterium GWC2_73_18]
MSRVVHFEICADDPERLAGFYRDALGWEVATWEGPQAYWLVTTGPDGTPGINGGIMGRNLPQPVVNTVSVESLEETTRRIEELGGRRLDGPMEVEGVGQVSYFTDPEGTIFSCLQPAMPA